jgi:hypothetical protein
MIYSGQPGGAYDAMSGSFALLAPIAISAVAVYVAGLIVGALFRSVLDAPRGLLLRAVAAAARRI